MHPRTIHENLQAEQTALLVRMEALLNEQQRAFDEGDMATAERLEAEYKALMNALGEISSQQYALTTSILGAVLRSEAAVDSTEVTLGTAVADLRAAGATETREYALLLGNYATHLSELRALAQAEDYFAEAITLLRRISDNAAADVELAMLLLNNAALYQEAGQFQIAMWQIDEAQQILAHAAQHADDHALLHLRLLEAELTNRRGRTYEGRNDFTKATEQYELSVNRFRELGARNALYYTTALHDLARMLLNEGDNGGAEARLQEALDLDRQRYGAEHPEVAADLFGIAEVYAITGRSAEAAQAMLKAAAIEDAILTRVCAFPHDRQLSWKRSSMLHLHAFLKLVVNHFAQDPFYTAKAMEWLLRRKGIVAEAVAAQTRAIREASVRGDPAMLETYTELLAVRGKLNRSLLSRDDLYPPVVRPETIAEWAAREKEIELKLLRQLGSRLSSEVLARVDLGAISNALPEHSALVEYIEVAWSQPVHPEDQPKKRYLAFVLSPGKLPPVQVFDLGPADDIANLVFDVRRMVRATANRWLPWRTRRLDQVAGRLRAAVFDPVQQALDGCRLLFIAADAALCQLPFEILPLGKRRLIDEHQIVYLTAGRDLLRRSAAMPEYASPAVVVADPDYDLAAQEAVNKLAPRGMRRFGRLRGARGEGKEIGKLLGVEPLLGPEALEGRIKAHKSPRILHLATHGFYLADARRYDPKTGSPLLETDSAPDRKLRRLSGHWALPPELRCGLALAGVNSWLRGEELHREAEDGLLMAMDVPELDLTGTQLVCLSACESGLGDVTAGEGVFGLSRAFLIAGAATVVVSLWKVPDLETREMMKGFYSRLKDGTARREALQSAQQDVRRKRSHPFYWGAFVCLGDPSELAANLY